jgi:3,4-dihydroxy-2-butanone 4-phosphate synthase
MHSGSKIEGDSVARWTVEYQGADKKSKTTHVTADDKYKTASEVTSAISEGDIPDLYVKPGHIILVQKYEGMAFA